MWRMSDTQKNCQRGSCAKTSGRDGVSPSVGLHVARSASSTKRRRERRCASCPVRHDGRHLPRPGQSQLPRTLRFRHSRALPCYCRHDQTAPPGYVRSSPAWLERAQLRQRRQLGVGLVLSVPTRSKKHRRSWASTSIRLSSSTGTTFMSLRNALNMNLAPASRQFAPSLVLLAWPVSQADPSWNTQLRDVPKCPEALGNQNTSSR